MACPANRGIVLGKVVCSTYKGNVLILLYWIRVYIAALSVSSVTFLHVMEGTGIILSRRPYVIRRWCLLIYA